MSSSSMPGFAWSRPLIFAYRSWRAERVAIAVDVSFCCRSTLRCDVAGGLTDPADRGIQELHLVRGDRSALTADRVEVIAGIAAHARAARRGACGLDDRRRGDGLVEVGDLEERRARKVLGVPARPLHPELQRGARADLVAPC